MAEEVLNPIIQVTQMQTLMEGENGRFTLQLLIRQLLFSLDKPSKKSLAANTIKPTSVRNWQSSLGLVKPCGSVFPSKKQDSGLGASTASASKESPQPRHLPEQNPRSRRSGRGSMGWWQAGGLCGSLALSGWTLGCWRVWKVRWLSWAFVLHHLLVAVTAGLPRVREPRAEGVNVITGCAIYTTAGSLTSWVCTALCFKCTMSLVLMKKIIYFAWWATPSL